MTPELFAEIGLSSALGLLPEKMDRVEARAMLICIALQESKLHARRQFGSGPARSYFQFERIGIDGVFEHRITGPFATKLCLTLDVGPTTPAVYDAIEFHDVLACGFARLNLWRLRRPLPPQTMPDEGWWQYLQVWSPGKPHIETWADNWALAWSTVQPS